MFIVCENITDEKLPLLIQKLNPPIKNFLPCEDVLFRWNGTLQSKGEHDKLKMLANALRDIDECDIALKILGKFFKLELCFFF